MWPAQEHAAVLRYRLLARGPDSQPEQVVVDVTGNLDGALADHPDGGEVLAIVCHAERRENFPARSPISTGLPRDCPRPSPARCTRAREGGRPAALTCTRIRSGYVGELQPAVARRQPAVARRQPAGARAARPDAAARSPSLRGKFDLTTGGRPAPSRARRFGRRARRGSHHCGAGHDGRAAARRPCDPRT